MLAGPNPKKRKLNEVANEDSQIEEQKDDSALRKENEVLKANYNAALNWIKSAEQHLDKNNLLQKFDI